MATAPLVRNAEPGRTDILVSSGKEQNQIKSLLINIAKCNVPIAKNNNLYFLSISEYITEICLISYPKKRHAIKHALDQ